MKKILVILTLLLIPSFASAAYFGSDENLILEDSINEDVYVSGGIVRINEEILGDLIIAGGEVSVEGDVTGDIWVIGGSVDIGGNVLETIRVLGGDVTVDGNINGEILAAGGTFKVKKGSFIAGNVYVAGGLVEIYGDLGKDLEAYADLVTIGGIINGSANLEAGEKIVLLDNSVVQGDLNYKSPQEIKDVRSKVVGEVNYGEIDTSSGEIAKEVVTAILIWQLFSFLSALLVTLVIIFIAPRQLTRFKKVLKENFWRSIGYGILIFCTTIVLGIGGFFIYVGIPLSLIIWGLFFALIYLSQIFLGATIGFYLIDKKTYSREVMFLVIALGLFIYKVVLLIPIIGQVVGLVAFFAFLGAFFLLKKEDYSALSKKKLV